MRVFAFVATAAALLSHGSAAPVATPTPDDCATVTVTSISKPTTTQPGAGSAYVTGPPISDSLGTVTPASSNCGAPTITVISDTSPLGETVTFSSGWPFPGGPGPVSLTTTASVPTGSGWQPGGPISPVASGSSSHILRPTTLL
ncbi:hypothetical protein V8D89_013657 [Ganoderma adspersum]